jgi:hypothetical protein
VNKNGTPRPIRRFSESATFLPYFLLNADDMGGIPSLDPVWDKVQVPGTSSITRSAILPPFPNKDTVLMISRSSGHLVKNLVRGSDA